MIDPDQTPLFTEEAIPLAELEREQAITRPQGLAALQDPNWLNDDASREYVAILDPEAPEATGEHQ